MYVVLAIENHEISKNKIKFLDDYVIIMNFQRGSSKAFETITLFGHEIEI